MLQFVKEILVFPELNLNSDHLNELYQFMDSQQIRTLNELQQTLVEKKPPNLINHQFAIFNYATSWFKITTDLIIRNKKIAQLWEQEFGVALESDDLLTLTIVSLPDDLEILNKLLNKISFAYDFSQQGEAGFIIVSLYSALLVKIEHLQEKKSFIISENIKQFLALHAQAEKIDCLKDVTKNYLNNLANLFEQRLEKIDKLAYRHYFSKRSMDNEIILKYIIAEINDYSDLLPNDKNIDLLPNDKNILLYIYKYQTAKNLLSVLADERLCNSDKITRFATKFSEFKILLDKNAETIEKALIAQLQEQLPAICSQISWYNLSRLVRSINVDFLDTCDYFELDKFKKWMLQTNNLKNSFQLFSNKLTLTKPDGQAQLAFLKKEPASKLEH